MADYIVTSGELTAVADAIREKNGTSGSLSWPNGFVEGISSGGGSWQTVFEGSVTTEQSEMGNIGYINYNEQLTADTLKITFDGIEYECEKISTITSNMYGGFGEDSLDFSEYPFMIMSTEDENRVFTESVGTHTLKIEEPQSGGSSDFSTAQVTIVNTTTTDVVIYMAVQFDDEEEDYSALMYDAYVVEGETLTVTAVLYKGIVVAYLDNFEEFNASVSGSAEYDRPNFDITGDCTITISPAQ